MVTRSNTSSNTYSTKEDDHGDRGRRTADGNEDGDATNPTEVEEEDAALVRKMMMKGKLSDVPRHLFCTCKVCKRRDEEQVKRRHLLPFEKRMLGKTYYVVALLLPTTPSLYHSSSSFIVASSDEEEYHIIEQITFILIMFAATNTTLVRVATPRTGMPRSLSETSPRKAVGTRRPWIRRPVDIGPLPQTTQTKDDKKWN